MMSLYDLVEGMLGLLEGIADIGAMTDEELILLDKLEAVWYNYYEKELRREENES